MKIKFNNTPEQRQLIKDIGSKNESVWKPALEQLAAFVSDVAEKTLSVAGSASQIFANLPYDQDDSPSIPLDLYWNEKVGFVTVWSQSMAGGLAYNETRGLEEMKFQTYRLDSALALNKSYARRARLDVVAKSINKMLQEVLIKQESNAWSVILGALSGASTNGLEHVIQSTTTNVFQLDDLNRLMTRIRRINTAFNGGTPADFDSKGLTDLYVSPEIKEQIRSFAYQPMNTRAGSLATSGATAVPLPDNVREGIFSAAGMQEIYGVNIHELLELGDNGTYNQLFDYYYGGAVTMNAGTDQVLVGFDLSRECFLRPIAQNAETGATFEAIPDNQFVDRQGKFGVYGSLEEGRICVDARAVTGIVV